MNSWEEGGCWPTPQQKLLLRAALWQNADGLAAWEEWKNSVDVERLDHGSTRLLPLLHQNLKAQGIDDPLMARFKSVSRYYWYQNQMMFGQAALLLRQLEDAGIKTMILKGAALISLHYKNISLRPMNDFDLMVPTAQAARAMELLREWGWQPDTSVDNVHAPELIDEAYFNYVQAQPFVNEREQKFDLHRHLIGQCSTDDADDSFWANAIPTKLNGVETLALNPADQILHACVHGIAWSGVPPFRWVADIVTILNTSNDINWEHLIEQARVRRLSLPVADALRYLKEELRAPIPESAMQKISALPVTKAERIEYSMRMNPRESWSPLTALWLRYHSFKRSQNSRFWLVNLLVFADYLRRLWKIKYWWTLPFYAWTRTVRQTRRWLNSLGAPYRGK